MLRAAALELEMSFRLAVEIVLDRQMHIQGLFFLCGELHHQRVISRCANPVI